MLHAAQLVGGMGSQKPDTSIGALYAVDNYST